MFDQLAPSTQQTLATMKSHYYYLNAKQNEDGSLGEIRITPWQLNELLAQAYLEGYHDH